MAKPKDIQLFLSLHVVAYYKLLYSLSYFVVSVVFMFICDKLAICVLHMQAMLKIHEHMHEIWKNQSEEQSQQSSVFSWIDSLPFNAKVKEWLVGEERYKQELHSKHILAAVADNFLIDRKADKTGASILCFDEIQVLYNENDP